MRRKVIALLLIGFWLLPLWPASLDSGGAESPNTQSLVRAYSYGKGQAVNIPKKGQEKAADFQSAQVVGFLLSGTRVSSKRSEKKPAYSPTGIKIYKLHRVLRI